MAPLRQRGFRGNNRGGRSDRGGRGARGQQTCRFFFQHGTCRFGANCSFSHNLSIEDVRERPEETAEQHQAKADYVSWKRLIKAPPQPNDNRTIERLWSGALTILNGDDRDWKQMLPRDLDDEEHHGRAHIGTLLSMKAHAHGHSQFVTLARPFFWSLRIRHCWIACPSILRLVGCIILSVGVVDHGPSHSFSS